ncbi:MAG: hypothetical protein NZZ41_06685 [Candidatus Dojkabacteria bacterium]|nr:hypothetical protein [Candidatus Dojkabacteria bacterium]
MRKECSEEFNQFITAQSDNTDWVSEIKIAKYSPIQFPMNIE